MGAVRRTPNGFKFIRISSHNPMNIKEWSAEIIFEDIDILSHPNNKVRKLQQLEKMPSDGSAILLNWLGHM